MVYLRRVERVFLVSIFLAMVLLFALKHLQASLPGSKKRCA